MGDDHASHQGGSIRSVSQISDISTNVVSLNLSHNLISSLKELRSFSWLINLNLSNNCVQSMQGLSALKQLKSLDLSLNNVLFRILVIFNDQISVVRDLGQLKDLLRLNISGNRLIDLAGFHEAWSLEHKLVELDVSDNPFADNISVGNQEILYLGGIRTLTELKIHGALNRTDILCVLPSLDSLNGLPVTSGERDEALRGAVPLFENPSPVKPSPIQDNHPLVVPVPYADPRTEAELVCKESQVQRLQNELNEAREELAREVLARKSIETSIKEKDRDWTLIFRKVEEELGMRESKIGMVEAEKSRIDQKLEEAKNECKRMQSAHEFELDQIEVKIESMHEREICEIRKMGEQISSLKRENESLLACLNKSREDENVGKAKIDQLINELSKRDESLRESEARAYRESHWFAEQLESLRRSDETYKLKIDESSKKAVEADGALQLALERERNHQVRVDEINTELSKSRREAQLAIQELKSIKAEYAKSLTEIETVVAERVRGLEARIDSKSKEMEKERNLRSEIESDLETLSQQLNQVVESEAKKRKDVEEEYSRRMKEEEARHQIEKTSDVLNEKEMHARVQEQIVKDMAEHVDELKREQQKSCDQCVELHRVRIEKDSLSEKVEDLEASIREKDETVAYISSEINSIRNGYEEKIASELKGLEKEHSETLRKMQTKLHEAARIMQVLERKLSEQDRICESYKQELASLNESKNKADKENQEKLNRLSTLFNSLCQH